MKAAMVELYRPASASPASAAPASPDLARLLAADEYSLRHLAEHLHAAGKLDRLYRLLTAGPAWMEAKFARLGGDAAFTADLDLAIQTLSDPLSPQGLQTIVKLHLARRIVLRRAAQASDQDLGILVWLGRGGEALDAARLRGGPAEVAAGLAAIASALLEKGIHQPALLGEAVGAARQAGPGPERARALARVVQAMLATNDGRYVQVLAEFETAAAQGETQYDRARPVLDLADWLARHRHAPLALSLLLRLPGSWDRDRALSALVERLEADGLDEQAENAARAVTHPKLQALALSRLGLGRTAVHRSSRVRCFREAIRLGKALEDRKDRSEVLGEVARAAVQAGCFDETRQAALAERDEWAQASLLPAIALALAQADAPQASDLFAAALRRVRKISNLYAQAAFRLNLAVALHQAGDPRAAEVFAQAVEAASEDQPADMASLALALSQAGDQRAGPLFDAAIAATRATRDSGRRMTAAQKVACALAAAGDPRAGELFHLAVEAADQEWDPDARLFDLEELARDQAEAGFTAEADETIQRIAEPDRRWSWQRRKTRLRFDALLQAGQLDEAEKVSDSVAQADRELDGMLAALARARLETGRPDEARRLAARIDYEPSRLDVFREIAASLARHEDPRAGEVFAQIRELARTEEERQQEQEIIWQVGQALAQAGDRRAAAFFEQSTAGARARRSAGELARLAAALSLAESPEADLLFSEAEALAAGIASAEGRARALKEISAALGAARRWSQAERVASSIPDVDSYVPPDELRALALRSLAAALAEAGELEPAERIAQSIRSPRWHTMALADVTVALAHQADPRAEGLLAAVRRSTEHIWDDDWIEVQLHIELGRALAAAGKLDEARRIASSYGDGFRAKDAAAIYQEVALTLERDGQVQAAMDQAQSIADDNTRVTTLRRLAGRQARRLAESGQFEAAQAIVLALPDPLAREQSLEDLAGLLAESGQFAQALALLGSRRVDEFLQLLAGWTPAIANWVQAGSSEPGMAGAVLVDAVAIAGWTGPSWQAVNDRLTSLY